ncbi:MAG: DNA lyase [Magnetococcales bacterium]|nr:DNA lyase [Magnetococcales bacterium]
MRLWTLHPRYLDTQGLVALWREALLAQKVLQGLTRGYTRHPQLHRFREQTDPVGAIVQYLHEVWHEAVRRGYQFDAARIALYSWNGSIQETTGQLLYEWEHFLRKAAARNPCHHASISRINMPEPHPLFVLSEGSIQPWERRQHTGPGN